MSNLIDKVKRTLQGVAPLTKGGAEVPDPKPRFLKTGIKRPPTQEQRLMAILKAHREQMATDKDYADETDFEDDEGDPDMMTLYEHHAHVYDMVPVVPEEKQEKAKPSAPQKAGDAEPSSDDTSE